MDPKTVEVVVFAEAMAALLAKTVADLKNLLTGGGGKTANEILDDADVNYQSVIDKAK